MALLCCSSVFSLVVLALLCIRGHGIVIDVYRGEEHVQSYSDETAETQGRAIIPQNSVLEGQMYYAVPYRNACQTVDPVNETEFNWIALIDNYFDCPGVAAWQLYDAGYGMMIAYSARDVTLRSTPSLPRAIVTSAPFVDFLRNYTIIGISPNASDYYIKVQSTNWYLYEKLFMIFGGVLLAAVTLSVVVFCVSAFCRTAVRRWRARGLSRWRVRQLPKRKYRKDKEVCESCSICLEDFRSGENLRVLPCDHIFHPSCVDEWLQKWNRTCPLCKSTIQRRGQGRDAAPPTTPPTTDQEHARLLSHMESEQSGEQVVVERRNSENYGAIGRSDNPLTTAGSLVLEEDIEGGEERGRLQRSVSVVSQCSDPCTQDRGGNSNLVRSGHSDITTATTQCTTSPLQEHA